MSPGGVPKTRDPQGMKKGALTKRRQQVCTVEAFLHTDIR